MKRLIAIFVAALTFAAAMSTNVFAADYNLTISADKTIALPGETVKLSANLDTNVGIAAMQFAFTFDPNDFELVDDAETIAYEEDNEVGVKSCMTYEFVEAYFDTYTAAQKWKYTTFGNQVKNGYQTILFGYAKDTAIADSKEIVNMLVGGALIKVKDTAAEEAKIWVTDIDCADGDSVVKELATNEITIVTKKAAEEATAETVAAWDTGDSLLVIGKLLKTDAAVYGVNIKDYVLPAEATLAGKGPDFPALAANPASDDGYYGINIIGIAPATYEVAAYADGVYADAISVTVAE